MLGFSYDPFNLTPGRKELSKEKWKKNGLYAAILQKALRPMNATSVRKSLTDQSFAFFLLLQISFIFFILAEEVRTRIRKFLLDPSLAGSWLEEWKIGVDRRFLWSFFRRGMLYSLVVKLLNFNQEFFFSRSISSNFIYSFEFHYF